MRLTECKSVMERMNEADVGGALRALESATRVIGWRCWITDVAAGSSFPQFGKRDPPIVWGVCSQRRS